MDTALYKTQLEGELANVTAELQGLGIHNPANTEDWIAIPTGTDIGEADQNVGADKAEELEERTSLLADLEARYNLITHALLKIANGTYGVCEIGEEQIEEERLAVNPSARTCIAHREEEGAL